MQGSAGGATGGAQPRRDLGGRSGDRDPVLVAGAREQYAPGDTAGMPWHSLFVDPVGNRVVLWQVECSADLGGASRPTLQVSEPPQQARSWSMAADHWVRVILPPVNEDTAQFALAPLRVDAPGTQSGSPESDPASDAPVMVLHWADVE